MPASHPPEFRQRAIDLARSKVKSVAEVAKDLSISESCLRNWLAQPPGYYTETDIWTSGNGVKRGAERLIFGRNGEVYYAWNHYEIGSFVRIR